MSRGLSSTFSRCCVSRCCVSGMDHAALDPWIVTRWISRTEHRKDHQTKTGLSDGKTLFRRSRDGSVNAEKQAEILEQRRNIQVHERAHPSQLKKTRSWTDLQLQPDQGHLWTSIWDRCLQENTGFPGFPCSWACQDHKLQDWGA